MAKKLTEQQYAAIAILSQPDRGGLTYEEVAEKVGVSRQALFKWRQDDAFNDEIKRQVMRNSIAHLPSVIEAIPRHIIEDGNAAMLRTFLQALGMLTEKVEVDTKGTERTNIDDIKAKIAQFKEREEK